MRTIFREGTRVKLIDQTRLPGEVALVECASVDSLCAAILAMRIRGAPALGVAGAYGVALAAEEGPAEWGSLSEHVTGAAERLRRTRPTAVNLSWGVARAMALVVNNAGRDVDELRRQLWTFADALADRDVEINRQIGSHGAPLLADGARVLTHCNAGALATVDWGTALGVVRTAARQGKRLHIYVDETRPFLQGSRLTAWELEQEGVPYSVITDNMAGHLMARGEIDLCIVGADRIAACGDVANKIGTYTVAVLARVHGLPFYVAAPVSTIDLAIETGGDIPIEERSPEEVLTFAGVRVAPAGARARHPAFDITPAEYVTGIITEMGIAGAPFDESLAAAVAASRAGDG
ncbi:MAG: S-methyl-5-thioribose-1-phosphate isomerase [Chloroflexi bacterium]|nr:S-methyl-5-thioribose-1-phosphate isomerase [Chloroflexota bacterium]